MRLLIIIEGVADGKYSFVNERDQQNNSNTYEQDDKESY